MCIYVYRERLGTRGRMHMYIHTYAYKENPLGPRWRTIFAHIYVWFYVCMRICVYSYTYVFVNRGPLGPLWKTRIFWGHHMRPIWRTHVCVNKYIYIYT